MPPVLAAILAIARDDSRHRFLWDREDQTVVKALPPTTE